MDGGKIEIKIGLSVSDEDAAACVWLLQLYLNNNPDKYLAMTKNADGETQMRLCENGTENPARKVSTPHLPTSRGGRRSRENSSD